MNDAIRQKIRASRIRQYEVAAKIGVSEYTLIRWLRRELTQEQTDKILHAIDELEQPHKISTITGTSKPVTTVRRSNGSKRLV